MAETYPRRHCWECMRRTLVCDFTRPQCNRCRASGVPCPGYGETKPAVVKWLEPGQVKSRTRRMSANRANGNGKATKMNESSIEDGSCDVVTKGGTSSSDNVVVLPLSNELKSPFHAMMEAVEYCKLSTSFLFLKLCCAKINKQRQCLHIFGPLAFPSDRFRQLCLQHYTRAVSEGRSSSGLSASRYSLHRYKPSDK